MQCYARGALLLVKTPPPKYTFGSTNLLDSGKIFVCRTREHDCILLTRREEGLSRGLLESHCFPFIWLLAAGWPGRLHVMRTYGRIRFLVGVFFPLLSYLLLYFFEVECLLTQLIPLRSLSCRSTRLPLDRYTTIQFVIRSISIHQKGNNSS